MELDFKVNCNMGVKVKLTPAGVEILRKRRERLNKIVASRGGKGFGEFELKVDEDGYYKTQLWMLFETFGSSMSVTQDQPFHLDIIIEDGEPIEVKS